MPNNVIHFQDSGALKPETRDMMTEYLRGMIKLIEDGQVIGLGVVTMSYDHCSAYATMGRIGGYTMLGATDMLRHELVRVNDECG